MGLYIKKMKMPKSCEECLCHTRDSRYFDVICELLHRTIAMNTSSYEEPTIPPDDCPLIEVPEPHKRLVEFIDVQGVECDDDGTTEISLADLLEAYYAMKNAETVIEAE